MNGVILISVWASRERQRLCNKILLHVFKFYDGSTLISFLQPHRSNIENKLLS